MKDLNDIRIIYKGLSEINAVPGAMTEEGLSIIRQGIPDRIDIGKVKSQYAQPICIAARTIYELCDEVEKLRSEIKHMAKAHDDAEKKLLKKVALKNQPPCGTDTNARPKQSSAARTTNKKS